MAFWGPFCQDVKALAGNLHGVGLSRPCLGPKWVKNGGFGLRLCFWKKSLFFPGRKVKKVRRELGSDFF